MFTKTALLFGVFTAMGLGGFVAGHMNVPQGHAHPSTPTQEHPITLALEAKGELGLSSLQVGHLMILRDRLTEEIEPIHAKMRALQARAARAHETNDPTAKADIEREAKAIEAEAKPIHERFVQEAIKVLTPEQHQMLAKIVHARMAQRGTRDFPLMLIIESREQLGISPKQFTKLQFLQADFIREFAPLRERLETIHLEIEASGKPPSPETVKAATALHEQVKKLQAAFSHRAIQEVLNPEQRQKLQRLLHGDQAPATGAHAPGRHGG